MSQNGQTHLKSLAANAARTFADDMSNSNAIIVFLSILTIKFWGIRVTF